MTTTYVADIERRAALTELMSKVDPTDPVRRHRLVLAGRQDRYALLPRLAAAYVQSKLLEQRDLELD